MSCLIFEQVPLPASIRMLGRPRRSPATLEEIARAAADQLPDFAALWIGFLNSWLGLKEYNVFAGPVMRDGGWGYLAGLRYRLEPDEALIFTLHGVGSEYFAVQMTDPWMLTPNSRKVLTNIDLNRAFPNPDHSVTCVLAHTDPGYLNWLSTDGCGEGFVTPRWQVTPRDAEVEAMIGDCSVVKHSKLDDHMGNPQCISAIERAAQLARRAFSFSTRTRA